MLLAHTRSVGCTLQPSSAHVFALTAAGVTVTGVGTGVGEAGLEVGLDVFATVGVNVTDVGVSDFGVTDVGVTVGMTVGVGVDSASAQHRTGSTRVGKGQEEGAALSGEPGCGVCGVVLCVLFFFRI